MKSVLKGIKAQFRAFNFYYNGAKPDSFGKSLMFLDYMISGMRYGASASDYFEFAFYEKRHSLKKEFVCWKYKKHFYHVMNDYSKESFFADKTAFLQRFGAYIRRDWLDTRTCTLEQFKEFCAKHAEFIAKPTNRSCGRGVSKETGSTDPAAQLEQFRADGMLLEEILVQHHEMAALNAASVNTVRVGTVLIGGEVRILGTVLRCGVTDAVVDNFSAGGLCAKIDPETGIVITDGVNENNRRFARHPVAGILFHGFQIPHWDKVIETVSRAAREVEGVRYTGWDVAVLEDGVALIEGNFEGNMHVFQAPADRGFKKELSAILREAEKEKA